MTTSSVTIACPRCVNHERGLWEPDGGVCYLCQGSHAVQVDVAQAETTVGELRGKHEATRELLYEEGQDRDEVFTVLTMLSRQIEQQERLLALVRGAA